MTPRGGGAGWGTSTVDVGDAYTDERARERGRAFPNANANMRVRARVPTREAAGRCGGQQTVQLCSVPLKKLSESRYMHGTLPTLALCGTMLLVAAAPHPLHPEVPLFPTLTALVFTFEQDAHNVSRFAVVLISSSACVTTVPPENPCPLDECICEADWESDLETLRLYA